VAGLKWRRASDDERSGSDWRMRWTTRDIPLLGPAATIRIAAEDIKGLTTVRKVRVRR
jgi:hypothetical protein